MTNAISCSACGAPILTATAAQCAGLCMPCWKRRHHGRTPHELQAVRARGDDFLEAAWVALGALPFPAGLDGLDLDGAIDATAGCISTYLAQGALDGDRLRTLKAGSETLANLLLRLSGDAAFFVGALLSLCRAVLHKIHQSGPSPASTARPR